MGELAALPGWLADAGATAFIGLSLVIAVARGWLVPGRTVERLIEAERGAAQVQRERADEWRAVAAASAALSEQYGAQSAALTAEMTTQTALIRSMRELAARRRDET
ncbi:MAG: hypothetical protein V4515_14470 [Chloroflexota bacterium]